MKLIRQFGLGLVGSAAALGLTIATPEAKAGGIYWNNGGEVRVQLGHYAPHYYSPAPRYYAPAPYRTTVKHNEKNDTIKVCTRYYHGGKTCSKWSY